MEAKKWSFEININDAIWEFSYSDIFDYFASVSSGGKLTFYPMTTQTSIENTIVVDTVVMDKEKGQLAFQQRLHTSMQPPSTSTIKSRSSIKKREEKEASEEEKEQEGEKDKEDAAYVLSEPRTALHCCQWSKNVASYNWIAYGGHGGILRVCCVDTPNAKKQSKLGTKS